MNINTNVEKHGMYILSSIIIHSLIYKYSIYACRYARGHLLDFATYFMMSATRKFKIYVKFDYNILRNIRNIFSKR